MELLIALSLAAVLLLAMVQLAGAGAATARLQDEQADLQDRLRFVNGLMFTEISQAAYSPEPWNGVYEQKALGPGNRDNDVFSSDRLVLRTWSDRNCFDRLNTELDSSGQHRFFIRETAFDLNGSNFLTRTCRYGPSPTGLVTQVRRQGLVGGVESFQLLFGEDADEDGIIEQWVRAGHWSDERKVLGVRTGIVLAGKLETREPRAETFLLPCSVYRPRPDGKLRRAFEFTWAIRSRQR